MLKLSSLTCHVYMVNRGWGSADLDAMSEDEFLALYDTQIAMDEARAEAERDGANSHQGARSRNRG